MKSDFFGRNARWIIPLVFLVFSMPSALDFIFHYPDEKYYTDSVIQMMEKGDYLTPFKADGSPRFLKPVITYWVVMASYMVFGISPLSSRLLFWLSGGLLVWITFRMAKSVTGNSKIASFSALITASNPLVILSSSRSIPDILLVLFLTISAWGFIEIMLDDKPRKRWYWMAYMGAALAFETKGFPAAAFTVVSVLFILLNPWKRKKLPALLEPFSIITALVVALSWFAAMYFIHGSNYFSAFYNDQVGERLSSKIFLMVKNGFLGISTLILFFIPWTVVILAFFGKIKPFFCNQDNSRKALMFFILSWVLLILIMSASVLKFYDRYVLPVVPLVSVSIAMFLTDKSTVVNKFFKSFFLFLNGIILGLGLLYVVFIHLDPHHFAGLMAGIILLIVLISVGYKKMEIHSIVSLEILFLFFNVFVFLHSLLMPNPGEQLAGNLAKNGAKKGDSIYVYGNIRTASNLRIQSHNSYKVIGMDTTYRLPDKDDAFLVISERDKKRLNLADFEIYTGSEELKEVPVEKFGLALQPGIKKIKSKAERYFIARKKIENRESQPGK